MNDNRLLAQMARGAGIAFIYSIFGFGLLFLFRLFAARYFGPEDFGVFSLLETIFGVSLLISGLGLLRGIRRYVPYYSSRKEHSLLKGYLQFVTITSLTSSVLFSILIYVFSTEITAFFGFPVEFSRFLELLTFILPLKLLDQIFRQTLVGYKKIGFSKFSNEVLEKSILIIGIGIIWFLELEVIWLVIFYLIARTFPLVFDYLVFLRFNKIPKKVKPSYMQKEWLFFSLPLLLSGVFGFVIGWTDNILIARFLEPAMLGIYATVFSLAGLLKFFQRSFALIFLPLVSENLAKKDNQITFLFKKASSWVFGFSFPIFLVFLFYSEEILTLLYGPSYSIGYGALMILSVGFLINVGSGLGTQVIMLHKKTNIIFYVNILVAILNIVLNLILIPIHGIMGAAVASAVSMAMQNLIFYYFASRMESLPFDFIYYLKFIVAGIPAVFLASLMFRLGINDLFAAIFAIGLYGGLYLLFLLILKTFTKEDFLILLMIEKKLGINLRVLKRIVMRFY